MRLFGIIIFCSSGNEIIYERQYKCGGERARLIEQLSTKEGISYYQIKPFAQYWHKNLKPDRRIIIDRPKPEYTNIPTYQYK